MPSGTGNVVAGVADPIFPLKSTTSGTEVKAGEVIQPTSYRYASVIMPRHTATSESSSRSSSNSSRGSKPANVRQFSNSYAWLERAACRGKGPNLWAPEGKGIHASAAKAVCEACPVRQECLDDAIEQNERFGIRGGLSYKERLRYKRERERGQLRKLSPAS